MKFALNVLNFGPGANPRSLRDWAEFAESAGYHAVMISDHIAVTPDIAARYPEPFYDGFTVLAWLAGITSRVELGTTVTVLPYRHPLQVARIGSDIDQLSHGRFILGAGLGWARQEFQALGIPFARRARIADEYLAAIHTLWANDVASYHGEFVSFENVHTAPRPVRSPRPPIWVGGNSDAAMRRAVRFGDAWHPINIRLGWLKERVPGFREIAIQEKRSIPALCPRINLRITDRPVDGDQRLAGQGTIDQIHSDLQELENLGASYVTLDTYSGHPTATHDFLEYRKMLSSVAERIVDLQNERLR